MTTDCTVEYKTERKNNHWVVWYRFDHWAPGMWSPGQHPIDDLLDAVSRRLGIKSRKDLYRKLNLPCETVSRMRGDPNYEMPLHWYIHIYDLSGMTIEEQRSYLRCKPVLERHPKALSAHTHKPYFPPDRFPKKETAEE